MNIYARAMQPRMNSSLITRHAPTYQHSFSPTKHGSSQRDPMKHDKFYASLK